MSIDRDAHRPDSNRLTLPFSRTLLTALILEGLMLTGAGVMLARAGTPPKPPEIIQVAFENPKTDVKKPEVKKAKPKPVQKPVRKPIPHRVVHRVQPPPPIKPPPPPPVKPLPVVNDSLLSVKVPVKPPPPPSPPQPPPPNDSAAKEASFAAALKAAIQAAVVYPPAARMIGFQGKTLIEFVFKNGVCSQIRVIRSSGEDMIDRAAIAAVSKAIPPPMPASLMGRSIRYQVTVSFTLDQD